MSSGTGGASTASRGVGDVQEHKEGGQRTETNWPGAAQVAVKVLFMQLKTLLNLKKKKKCCTEINSYC